MEERAPRIVFGGGGTGGHLYPALAVANELERRGSVDLLFIGAERGIERRLVPQAGYTLRSLRLSGLKGASRLRQLRSAWQAAAGVLRCLGWMLRRRPDLVIGVGGFASGPAVLAARILGVRTMLMEQNHYPGATNRWLAPRVDLICLPSNAARERVRGRAVVTGNPVREEFVAIGPPPDAAAISLLAFGGSRGASSINRALCDAAAGLAEIDPAPQVVHQTGVDDAETVREGWAATRGIEVTVLPYIDDMASRLAAADLAVCRAGATTLAELAAAGRPALLVPYPHAADDHQTRNAETMRDAGAAQIIADAELDGPRLVRAIGELAADRPRLRAMAEAARGLALPDATASIADLALKLIDGELS